MRNPIFLLSFLAAACTALPPPPQPETSLPAAVDPAAEILSAHNRARAAVGVAPIAWDPALAAGASLHARTLAALGHLRHSSRQSRPGQGENLWMGTRGAFSPAQMVGSWASERTSFRPGIFPAVSRTGNWADVGHYSQMIWPTTTRLGCALASGPRHDALVCRYAPAGNVDGRRVP